MSPDVTVLMPARNAAITLPAAMRSILCQSFRGFEVVAVDDGSDDETLSVLRSFAAEDRRVRVVSIEKSGIVGALNAGLSESRGEYIARMDADDLAGRDRLRLQAAFLDAHPRTVAVGSRVRIFPRGVVRPGMAHYERWLNSVVTPSDITRDMFIESPLAHPSVMFRRREVESLGGYRDMGWPEDYDLWLRMAEAGMGIAKLPETLLFWRDGAERLSRMHGMYSPDNFRRVKAHFLDRWRLSGARKLQLWGAGRDGKAWAKLLMKTGFTVSQFVDIDIKKVGGQACGGIPVVCPADIIKGMPLLCAVGVKTARPQIREYLLADGFREPEDFFFLS